MDNEKIVLGFQYDPGPSAPEMEEYDDYIHLVDSNSDLEIAMNATNYHEPFVGMVNEYQDAAGTLKVYYNKRYYDTLLGDLPTKIEIISCAGITLSSL